MRNEPWSAITHLIGAIGSIVALVALVTAAAIKGTAVHVTGFALFGASLVLLYTSSTLYHFFRHGRTKRVFRRIDHAMIFILIAGTYTPVMLTLGGPWGWTILSIVWATAALGAALKGSGVYLPPGASTALYVLIGWVAIIAAAPLHAHLGTGGLAWLVLGGVLYTAGAVVFAVEERFPRKKHWDLHELFHIFIMLGSLSHVWLMWRYVLPA